MQDFSQWAHTVIFWYKSVYDSDPSLRASSLFWGNPREKLHENRSLASGNGDLDHRAKLIRDLTRELKGVKLL